MSLPRYETVKGLIGEFMHQVDDGTWVLFSSANAEIARLTAEVKRLRSRCDRLRDLALDASSGMEYIEQTHGRLSGVGWDRVRDKRILCEQHGDIAPEGGNEAAERAAKGGTDGR